MPLYDFSCQDCQQTFEKIVRTSDEQDGIACPTCSSHKVEKLLSVPARPMLARAESPTPCGQGPPCGAPWCQRTG